MDIATFPEAVGDEDCVPACTGVGVDAETRVAVLTGTVGVYACVEVGPGGRISNKIWICSTLFRHIAQCIGGEYFHSVCACFGDRVIREIDDPI